MLRYLMKFETVVLEMIRGQQLIGLHSARHQFQNSEKIVFCVLFPWIYPGGNGDFDESPIIDITVKDWASQHLYRADGWFARDNT
jgi:hypothetical protein